MKQVLQNRKTGRPFVGEVPVPALQRGRVLVRTVASLISAGTERAAVELVSKGLVQEARQRPDLVKAVVAKVKNEGLLNTFTSVRAQSFLSLHPQATVDEQHLARNERGLV